MVHRRVLYNLNPTIFYSRITWISNSFLITCYFNTLHIFSLINYSLIFPKKPGGIIFVLAFLYDKG